MRGEGIVCNLYIPHGVRENAAAEYYSPNRPRSSDRTNGSRPSSSALPVRDLQTGLSGLRRYIVGGFRALILRPRSLCPSRAKEAKLVRYGGGQ